MSISTATSVDEGGGAVFTVTLANPAGYSALGWSVGGTATSADYSSAMFSNGVTQNANGTLNVPAGVNSFTITLPILADQTTEGAETLTVTVGSISATTTVKDTSVPVAPVTMTADAQTGAGFHVSYAGDVNGDGYDDMVVAQNGNQATKNQLFVVFGNSGNLMPLDLVNMSATQGFVITEPTVNNFTNAIQYAGDLNGDGLADLVIGSRNEGNNSGRVYVLYGKTDGTAVSLAANMGTRGYVIEMTASTQYVGDDVSTAGDFNGDGLADLLIGAAGGTRAYVVYSQKNYGGATISLDTLGTNGLTINNVSYLGRSVGNIGDINGDGLADVLVGGYDTTGLSAGRAYVVYGRTDTGAISATSMGSGGFRMDGNTSNNFSGIGAGAGDVNGDGIADIVVGANGANEAYVIFGSSALAGSTFKMSDVGVSVAGFRMVGSGEQFGIDVSYAGDINGDGLADMIVGARANDAAGINAGRAYVVYGKTDSTTVYASDLEAGKGGFAINGGAAGGYFGHTVSNAGDLNGDGYDDLVVGAYLAGGSLGSSYVIYGGPQFVSGSVATGSGTVLNELVLGTRGDDTLVGGGGIDRFSAGVGNDTIVLTASDVTNLASTSAGGPKAYVDGGGGYDTIRLSGGASLNLTTITNIDSMGGMAISRINSIERIDMATDTGANTLTLNARDVNDLSGFNLIHTGSASADGKTWTNVSGTPLGATTNFHQLVVDGGSNDALTLAAGSGGWLNMGAVSNGTSNYTVFQNNTTNSQVLVKQGMQVNNSSGTPSALDLGTVSGVSLKLIMPVTVTGKTYYFLDLGGNGAPNYPSDLISHDALDTLFNRGVDTTTVNSTRTVTVNGYTLVLPTVAEFQTMYGSNGSKTPTGWDSGYTYWAADSTGAGNHSTYNVGNNANSTGGDGNVLYAALQVIAPAASGVAPVVLDLNRDGTIGYTQQLMDVNTDGVQDFSAWAAREDGVLVWNKLGNGMVTDASQYAFTAYGGNTDLEGLRAGFDSNGDGVFSALDAKWGEFGVWQDANGNGVTDAGELRSLSELGVKAIHLTSDGVAAAPAAGVTEAGRTTVEMTDGSTLVAADSAFSFQTVPVLNLDAVLKEGVANLANGQAEVLRLTSADVLGLPANAQGVHQLKVLGDGNDIVTLEQLTADGQQGVWSNSATVTQDGQLFNVYQHSADPHLQVLIDQHMATGNVHQG